MHGSGKYVEELSITWDLFAGKTALRQSLMRSNALNHSCMPLFSLRTSWAQDRKKGILFQQNQDERTRGIEISVVKDSDIVVSIWDLAGQEEYHAFHDYMMPNFGDVVNPCSFFFLFDPTWEMHAGEKNRSRKKSKVLKEELIYWLQFIASNTPPSIAFPPQLTVILTHADKDLHGGLVEWAEQVVQNARTTFKDIVNISPNIYALNVRSTNEVRPVLDFLFESSQQLLKKMPLVFVECAIIRRALANRAKNCLIKWNTFCDLCIQEVPTLTQGNKEQGRVEPYVVLKRQKAIAANLHDTGDIIYFEGLEFVVVNPNWFCHDVMGFLINFRGIPHESDDGFATKSYMERILAKSLSKAITNTPSKGGMHLQPNDLMRLMLNFDICYERDPGNLDAGIYIPTILDANFSITEREKIVEGSRELTWPPFQEQHPKWVFLGRRLECKDRIRTFLTPGFFPRLQVRHQHPSTLFKMI
jgi:GTPase SAR1 family protein